jgi:hypothetical protein
MKKLLMAIVSCLCLACCALFGACGTDGTYKLQKIKYVDDDTEMTVNIGDKFEGMELKEDTYVLIVKGDKAILRQNYTYEINDETKEYTDVYVGTWVKGYEDEIYFVSEDGEDTYIAKKDGKVVTIEVTDDLTIVLSK